MTDELQHKIVAKELALANASTSLESNYASLQKLQRELPSEAGRVQRLMQELAALRQSLPAAHPTSVQPAWYDNILPEGSMGDRGLKNQLEKKNARSS